MSESDLTELPEAAVRPARRGRLSLIWLVPIVAALIGVGLLVRALLSAGTMITISFPSAEGLETGVTEVRYKDVVVGKVRSIALSDDLQSVNVSVELERRASRLAVADTRFWIVRPRIDTGGISGLGTLVSGVYISMDVGKSASERRTFEGLDKAPAVPHDQPGTSYVLRSTDLGSLGVGSPVYFHRIPVGRIGAFDLDEDGRGVTMQVFVQAPYDRFVTADSRFWNASGVELTVSAAGLQMNTESLATVLAGGVAFETPQDGPQAEAGTTYWLHGDKLSAMGSPSGPPVMVSMHFEESLRGLSVGAPIDFRGVTLGSVQSISMDYDRKRQRFVGQVVAQLYPLRLGDAYESFANSAEQAGDLPDKVVAKLVHDGLKAQLSSGNLLTGQLYVALDIDRAVRRPVRIDGGDGNRIEIPTQRASMAQLQSQVGDVMAKLSKVPFDRIGDNLSRTLANTDALVKQLNGQLAPEAARTLSEARKTLEAAGRGLLAPDSATQQDLRQSLDQLERAGRSLRGLTDYLQRHPEALLRGKSAKDDPQPGTAPEDAP